MRKALCLALVFCLCLCTAMAEPQLIPQLSLWDGTGDVEAVISANVRTHMPFDDERCAQLNGLLKHLSLRLQAGGPVSRVAVLVDGQEAVWLARRTTEEGPQIQTSWAEGTFACDMDTLLGGGESISLANPRETWLEDGITLLEGLGQALESYKKESGVKTSIKNMGVARTKAVYTVPKAETEVFARAMQACGVAGLTFSGQQKLTLWRDQEGNLLRSEYTGQCGRDAESLRKVNLAWRLCREDSCTRDEITLKTPAVKGGDYNTLTCSRHVERKEDGKACYTLTYDYAVKSAGAKSAWAGKISLESADDGQATRLTGSVELSTTPAGADAKTTLVLLPQLAFTGEAGLPAVSGLVTVQQKRGKNIIEDGDITMQISAGMPLLWVEEPAAALTEEARSSLASGMASALVRRLVLLPGEDTLFLSADLPEETWQLIVDGAQAALIKEETP